MIGRLLELFEGPEAPGPWSPPAMPAALHSLLPWRAFDESSELYVNAGSTGFVVAHVGGVQASLLAAQRLLYRLHRAGLAWGTFGSGALCGRYPMPVMKKSQYRWQMTQPVPAVDPFTGCNPTGRSSVLWETLRELPVAGENFGYLLWRKRNCCLL